MIDNLSFLNTELRESRLFRSDSALKQKSAEDIKNILFLSFEALALMSYEFSTAPWVGTYLTNTFRKGYSFNNISRSDTDLYWAIYIISNKKADLLNPKLKEENEFALNQMNLNTRNMIMWVKKVISGKATQMETRRFLTNLQDELKINVNDYRLMARAIGHWEDLDVQRRQVVGTRLQFALNKHMRMSEIYPELESLNKNKKYFDPKMADPETYNAAKSGVGGVAKTAGMFAGAAALGSLAGIIWGFAKAKKDRSSYRLNFQNKLGEDATVAASIATTAIPLGQPIKRTQGLYVKKGDRKPKK